MSDTETAFNLLSGQGGPVWKARTGAVRDLLGEIIGMETPALGTLRPYPPDKRPPPMLPTNAVRTEAEDQVVRLIRALTSRRFSELSELLHEEVWALWPTGHIGLHRKVDVIKELERRPGRAVSVEIGPFANYTFSELNNVLVKGIPLLLDLAFSVRTSLTISCDLYVPNTADRICRVFFVMSPGQAGWRSRTLIFAAVDDAVALSRPLTAPEGGPVHLADHVVRRYMLGHGAQLRSLESQMMDQIWWRDGFEASRCLADAVGGQPHRIQSADVVFEGSEEIPLSGLDEAIGPEPAAQVRAQAGDYWGAPFRRLNATLVRTAMGAFDPDHLRVAPLRPAHALVLTTTNPLFEREEFRLAALAF